MTSNLVDAFHKYFEMIPANTDSLKKETYRLRYQVYCIETGFEMPEHCPDELEKDEFDDKSEHFLIRHRRSGEYAATTRLILPDTKNLERPFPIEQHCIIDRMDLVRKTPRTQLAEVSRFCVSKSFKKRQGESGTTTGVSAENANAYLEDERRVFPHITLALIACLVRMNYRHGLTHWYAVMETALIRFLTHVGIYFTPIGPIVDYHGKRQPCIIEVDYLLEGVKNKNPEVWELLTNRGAFWTSDQFSASFNDPYSKQT